LLTVVAALPLPRPVLPVMQKTHTENGRRKRLLKRLGCHLTFNALPLKPLRRHPPVHARERRGMPLTRRKRLQCAAHQLCRAEDEAPISLTGGPVRPDAFVEHSLGRVCVWADRSDTMHSFTSPVEDALSTYEILIVVLCAILLFIHGGLIYLNRPARTS
jgi:hypothetical protein